MASIYDSIPAWSAVSETKFDIVSYQSKYFYAIRNMTAAENNTAPTNSLQSNWDGYINFNNVLIPNFFWKPSYQTTISSEPRVRVIQYGNGYQQRVPDGINPDLITFNANFDNRKEKEAVSILHFLKARKAQESFIYNLPIVYSKSALNTRFISSSWSVDYNSYNNYSIKAKFQEVPV